MKTISTPTRKNNSKMLLVLSVTGFSLLIVLLTPSLAQADNLFDIFNQALSLFNDVLNVLNFQETDPNNPNNQAEQALENKPDISYGIIEDDRKQQTVDNTQQTANNATLSSSAREQLSTTAVAVETDLSTIQQLYEQSQQLGQDSQNSDVSQQILQNISQQLALASEQAALTAQQQGVIVQQNQQAQVDRALNNLVAAQQAQELSEETTAQRREQAATAAFSTSQLGLIRPAGLPLANSNPPPSSQQPLTPNQVFGTNF
jgi:hypothetical protein